MHDWFKQLYGFSETDYERTQSSFSFAHGSLTSHTNGRSWQAGDFSTPTLASLREAGHAILAHSAYAPIVVEHIAVADALGLHARCPGALFQVASQLNCLEFPTPRTTPEDGVTGYAEDMTQGPACSLACASSTVVRNYLLEVGDYLGHGPRTTLSMPAVPVGMDKRGGQGSGTDRLGQHHDAQINNIDLLESALPGGPYWRVANGYTHSTPTALHGLAAAMAQAQAGMQGGRDELMGCIKVGLHLGAEVTFSSRFVESGTQAIRVGQAFCSAVSIAYAQGTTAQQWEPLARLLLDAHYEATLWAGLLNAERTGCRDVYLTFVGGGVFGNPSGWIDAAIGRAVAVLDKAARSASVSNATAGSDAQAPGSDISGVGPLLPLLRVRVCHYRAVDKGRAQDIDGQVQAQRDKAEVMTNTGS